MIAYCGTTFDAMLDAFVITPVPRPKMLKSTECFYDCVNEIVAVLALEYDIFPQIDVFC